MKFGTILMIVATTQALISWTLSFIFKDNSIHQFCVGFGAGNNILQIIALVFIFKDK